MTRDASHEKLGAALNIDGPDVIVATSGYFGDAPPYQGHVVLIDRASGRVQAVFNTLCSDRRAAARAEQLPLPATRRSSRARARSSSPAAGVC